MYVCEWCCVDVSVVCLHLSTSPCTAGKWHHCRIPWGRGEPVHSIPTQDGKLGLAATVLCGACDTYVRMYVCGIVHVLCVSVTAC